MDEILRDFEDAKRMPNSISKLYTLIDVLDNTTALFSAQSGEDRINVILQTVLVVGEIRRVSDYLQDAEIGQ